MDLISVIVPVYKVEKYLDKCISSIVNQTYQNLEIILVDDGSPDHCGKICDKWAAKDSRIKVIHQVNQGGGAARNAGLDIAKGNLIAFVDSDDYIAPEMFAGLKAMVDRGADIAECDFTETDNDNAILDSVSGTEEKYAACDAMYEHLQDRIFRQLIWNKLYRREVIGSVRFPTDKKIDDEFFTYQVLGRASVLSRCEQKFYAYRQQGNSIMHSISANKRLQAIEAKSQRHEYILEKFPELVAVSLKSLWFACIYQGQLVLRQSNDGEAKAAIKFLCTTLQRYPNQSIPGSAKEKLWLHLAQMSFENTCRLRNWLKIGL